MRNEVKNFYVKDRKAQEERRLRKEYNELNGIDDDSIDEYLKDRLQARIYEQFYPFIDEKYLYRICRVKSKENNINEGNDKNLNLNEEKEFCPGSIILKEKTSDFIKWISSIFQTINDSQISDYSNVNLIF